MPRRETARTQMLSFWTFGNFSTRVPLRITTRRAPGDAPELGVGVDLIGDRTGRPATRRPSSTNWMGDWLEQRVPGRCYDLSGY